MNQYVIKEDIGRVTFIVICLLLLLLLLLFISLVRERMDKLKKFTTNRLKK